MNPVQPPFTSNEGPPLIADPDKQFLDRLRDEFSHRGGSDPVDSGHLILASDPQEVLRKLADSQVRISGFFVNPSMLNPLSIPLLQASVRHRPNVPIFFMTDGQKLPVSAMELQFLTVRGILHKPLDSTMILKTLASSLSGFDGAAAIQAAAVNTDPLETQIAAQDKDFAPIIASNYVAGSRSFFDLYVRLQSNKYVKVLRAGDSFSAERLSKYTSKGLTHFHLRKEVQERYLQYFDKLAASLLRRTDAPVSLQTTVTLNQGDEVAGFLKSRGVTEESIQHARQFVENVTLLTERMRLDRDAGIQKFLTNVALRDHAVAATILASLLARELQFQADKSVHIVGLASMFHDLALVEHQELIDEDASKMSAEQLAIYHAHPEKSAAMLEIHRSVDRSVIQAIQQHHERRTRQGFPHRIGAGALNRVAEVIGLADEFAHVIVRSAKEPGKDLVTAMSAQILTEFSTPVVNAFQAVFKK
jgi:HD-GYP domain-containing protein (c-di-GMP phosphodiesterase class II)